MGRSKLPDTEKRRRYVFLLSPAAGDAIDAVRAGERSRFVSRRIEDGSTVDALAARVAELSTALAAATERYERAMAWLEGLPDPHLSTCAIHEAGAGWEACDCGCREAMAAAPRKRGGR